MTSISIDPLPIINSVQSAIEAYIRLRSVVGYEELLGYKDVMGPVFNRACMKMCEERGYFEGLPKDLQVREHAVGMILCEARLEINI